MFVGVFCVIFIITIRLCVRLILMNDEWSGIKIGCEPQTYFRSSLLSLRKIRFSRRVKIETKAEKTGCSRRLELK